MRYGSVCSGIEAATMGWHHLGWEPAFFSDIDPFPRAVLSHHYPDIPLHGDFTTIGEDDYGSIELLVGGTPCQSFSIAGLRTGLDDDRGNLALEYLRLAQRERPKWLVWENVPGVLSSNGGRDFGAFLGALAELGYGFAYRVLDAQYFGVAQRRRRVFVVGYLGDWRRAVQVLFERESLSGNPAPIREPGEKPAPPLTHGPPYSRTGNERTEIDAYVPVLARCLTVKEAERQDYEDSTDLVAFAQNSRNELRESPIVGALSMGGGKPGQGYHAVRENMKVRRLTPRECERLQGFPDDFTKIPYRNKPASECPDGPRYKALGNSMAVPVMNWIGERIEKVARLAR